VLWVLNLYPYLRDLKHLRFSPMIWMCSYSNESFPMITTRKNNNLSTTTQTNYSTDDTQRRLQGHSHTSQRPPEETHTHTHTRPHPTGSWCSPSIRNIPANLCQIRAFDYCSIVRLGVDVFPPLQLFGFKNKVLLSNVFIFYFFTTFNKIPFVTLKLQSPEAGNEA